MPVSCIAYNCRSKREKGVGFHRFPHENPKLLKLWIAKLKWKDWTPSPNTMICSKHFEAKDVDVTGFRPRLRPGAVPTIFDFPESIAIKPRKVLINPRSKRATTDPGLLTSLEYLPVWRRKKHLQQTPRDVKQSFHAQPQSQAQKQPAEAHKQPAEAQKQPSEAHKQPSEAQKQPAEAHKQPSKAQKQPSKAQKQPAEAQKQPAEAQKQPAEAQKQPAASVAEASIVIWPIVGDASMFRRRSLPSFFHSHYCRPQSFHWPGDAEANFEPSLTEKNVVSTIPHVIKVTGRWQWLGLDFRGPLPQTMNGDRFLLTVTDYHSKWVEAFPVTAMVSHEAAGILCDLFAQFGYPFGVLSRLSRDSIRKLNVMIRYQLKKKRGLQYDSDLIVHHRQTAYLDPVTESRIGSMVSELVKEHPDTWNVYLPGGVLRLCCSEHPTIGKSPFARMYLKEPQPVTTPRDLPFSPAVVEDSSFVVDLSEKSDDNQQQSAASQLTDTVGSEEVAGGTPLNGEGCTNGESCSNGEEQSR
ncbi:hypothetical protein AALO_G00081140 [Alosa alosa]|uniref:THAP domain-containing protein 1 n=1 Tax=Alosa alosa TaxID=278164 RepID=A0AAV6GXQ4_9TELE|nr:uncharacterized protein zgc:163143 isoform X1 [Alosa alosa]KAG5279745.1 hypothetical protein AALO_G00081140 [Alosa alosa]